LDYRTQPKPPRHKFRFGTVIPFVLFIGFLALWTYELLTPNPVPEWISNLIPDEWKFNLAKGLHVAGYAFLTLLAAFLPIPRLYYWLVVAGLFLHGVGTEVGQSYVEGRHGSVRDVVLDWLGVGICLVIIEIVHQIRPKAYVHEPY
jgi:VanZ family protein